MTDDARWLREFVELQSEEAFARIVRQHVDLVYSAALRQLKSRELAEDMTQLAFTALALKAESLRKETVLPAWLLVTTRFLCLDALKSNVRRLRHEKRAAHMAKTIDHPPRPSPWDELAEHLDAALASLNADDRRAITLRYFNHQSLRQVAESMGTSLDAAKQRVHRATLRMRAFFEAEGLEVPASAIGPAIMAHAIHAAPSHLAATATSAALAAKSAVSATLATKGATILMASLKTKIIAGAATVLLLCGGTVVGWSVLHKPAAHVVVMTPDASITRVDQNQMTARFNEVYGLADGQVVKYVHAPYGPERQAYWDAEAARTHGSSWKLHDYDEITFNWDEHGAHWTCLGGGGGGIRLAMRFCAHLREYEIDDHSLIWDVNGDWVCRKSATSDQTLTAIAEVVSQRIGHPVRFVHHPARKDVVVVRGEFKPDFNLKDGLFVSEEERRAIEGRVFLMTGSFSDLLAFIEGQTGKKLINECTAPTKLRLTWRGEFPFPPRDKLSQTCQMLAKQTSLRFDAETRDVMVWSLAEGPAPEKPASQPATSITSAE